MNQIIIHFLDKLFDITIKRDRIIFELNLVCNSAYPVFTITIGISIKGRRGSPVTLRKRHQKSLDFVCCLLSVFVDCRDKSNTKVVPFGSINTDNIIKVPKVDLWYIE